MSLYEKPWGYILDVEWDDNGDILAKTMLSHRIEED